jgi:hypothetical protein
MAGAVPSAISTFEARNTVFLNYSSFTRSGHKQAQSLFDLLLRDPETDNVINFVVGRLQFNHWCVVAQIKTEAF